jgi:Glycosyl hydrolase family 71
VKIPTLAAKSAVLACAIGASAALTGAGPAVAARPPAARRPAATRPAVPRQRAATRPAAASPTPLFAYYYLWYSHGSWNRAKTDYPLIGRYSSDDTGVMRRQIEEAKSAGIDGFIVSWKDTATNDRRLRLLMGVAGREHFKLAMIYQGLDFSRRPLPVAEVAADFKTFCARYAGDPVFFRLGGRPLTIWSGTWAYSPAAVGHVTSAVRGRMLVLSTAKNVAGFRRLAGVTDGDAYYWSSVNPATDSGYPAKLAQMSDAVHGDGKYWIAPFAPGFDARLVGGTHVVPRDGGRTLRREYAAAERSSPDVLGLISWNEFSENSYIEPSVRYGYQSLDALRQLRGTPVPTPSGPGAPSDAGGAVPNGAAPAAGGWPSVLRASCFALALVAVVGGIGIVRRRRTRDGLADFSPGASPREDPDI